MKKYARISGEIVAELFSTDDDIATMFHPSLVWVDATTAAPAPQVGWSYADGVFSAPDGPTLAQVQTAQIAIIEAAYQVAIQQPVSYMSTTFQADLESQDVLARSLVPGAVPSGFFWLDANNSQVPMTFAQLQGLAGAMLAQGQAAFSKKTGLKQQIRAATSIFAAQSIVWS